MGTRFQYQNQRLRLWLLLRWQKKNKEAPDSPVDGASYYNMSGVETLHGRYAVMGILGQGSVLDGLARRRSLVRQSTLLH